jgi:hypothetical protein
MYMRKINRACVSVGIVAAAFFTTGLFPLSQAWATTCVYTEDYPGYRDNSPINSIIRTYSKTNGSMPSWYLDSSSYDVLCARSNNGSTVITLHLFSIVGTDNGSEIAYREYRPETMFRENTEYSIFFPKLADPYSSTPNDGTSYSCDSFSDIDLDELATGYRGLLRTGNFVDKAPPEGIPRLANVTVTCPGNECNYILTRFEVEGVTDADTPKELQLVDLFGSLGENGALVLNLDYCSSIDHCDCDQLVGKKVRLAVQVVDAAGHRSAMSEEITVTIESAGCSCACAGPDAVCWTVLGTVGFLLVIKKRNVFHTCKFRRNWSFCRPC